MTSLLSLTMAEQRKRTSTPPSTAQALLQPIVPSSNGNGHHANKDDSEDKKKQTVTPWKARRQRFCCYFQLILVLLVVSFMSRGYHRRNQNEILRTQRREWMKFRTKHKIDEKKNHKVEDADFSSKDTFLADNPDVAKQWEKHLKLNPYVRDAFDQDAHDHPLFQPESFERDPVDWTANYLGEAVETVGNFLHHNAEPVLGKEVTHGIGNAVHDTVDIFGDFADSVNDVKLKDVQDGLTKGGQALYEGGQSFFENAVLPLWSASADSVSEWMGGSSAVAADDDDDENGSDKNASSLSSTVYSPNLVEEWANWTQGFINKAHSSAKAMWNYTTQQEADDEEEEEDDDDEGAGEEMMQAIDETKAAMFQGMSHKGGRRGKNKTAKSLPEFMTEDQDDGIDRNKFAFITTGFPQQADALWRFEHHVLGALKTYLQKTVLFYIVNAQARSQVDDVCASSEENRQACARLVPIYVKCPKRDYGIASCCHQDKGLAMVIKRYPKFDWYIYGQEDLYWRIDYLKNFVKKMPNPQTEAFLLSASPFHAHGQMIDYGVGAEDQMNKNSNCSTAAGHIYPWGKPAVVYSNAAMKLVRPAYENLAISKQCEAFHVPASAASPIVHWMFQLPVIQLPMISSRTPKTFAKQLMEVMSDTVKPKNDGKSDNKRKFNPSQRFVAFRSDPDRYNMSQIHDGVQAAKIASKQFKEIVLFPQPPHNYRYHRPNGYMETKLFEEHSFPQNWSKTWHVFEPSHCIPATKTLGINLLRNGKLDKEAVKRLKLEERNKLKMKAKKEEMEAAKAIREVEETTKGTTKKSSEEATPNEASTEPDTNGSSKSLKKKATENKEAAAKPSTLSLTKPSTKLKSPTTESKEADATSTTATTRKAVKPSTGSKEASASNKVRTAASGGVKPVSGSAKAAAATDKVRRVPSRTQSNNKR